MSRFRLVLGTLCAIAFPAFADDVFTHIQVDPQTVRLSGPDARHSLLITGTTTDGRTIDLSRSARLIPSDERLLRTEANVVRSMADGKKDLCVEAGGKSSTIVVQVTDSAKPREFHFENDIEPLFGRFGCNSSGCHGKAEGQNGFKLSVFGFDPEADQEAIARQARGRRLFLPSPEKSMLLTGLRGVGKLGEFGQPFHIYHDVRPSPSLA